MAKRINQLEETSIIADDNVFAMDSANEAGKTYKLTFNNLKKALNKNHATYVVQTFFSNTGWYRIWSDGFCEQGGKTQTEADNNIQYVKFNIPFKNADVFVNATPCGRDLGDNEHQGIYYYPARGYSITAQGFHYRNDMIKGDYVMWEAKGKVDLSKI